MNISSVRKLYVSCFGKKSTNVVFFTVLALTLYVCGNLLTSTSMISATVDMSFQMKSNINDIINSIRSRNISSVKPINGTYTLNSIAAQVNDSDKTEQVEANKIDTIKKPQVAGKVVKKLNIDNEDDKGINNPDRNPAGNKVETSKVEPSKSETESKESNTTIVVRAISPKESDGTHVDYDEDRTTDDGIEHKDEINKFGNRLTAVHDTRKVNCTACFNHDFNYVIQNEQICKLRDSTEKIDLIILILTTHSHTKARTAIRNTWLTHTNNNTANVRYAFLLGEINERKDVEVTLKENDVFHDIIMEDFIDSYQNLTYKTIMGFKWAATKCAHAQYVMKTDDDMFVNIPNVLRIFNGSAGSALQTAIGGSCSDRANPIRDLKSKWFASKRSYPEKYYPGYCSGTGYVTSMAVATKVYEISPSVPFFHLEDVYVSLCIRKLGFRLQGIPGFMRSIPRSDPCLYKGDKLITSHRISPTVLQMIWQHRCTIHSLKAVR